MGNAKEVVEEFEKEYWQDMEDVRKQERKEETFRKEKLLGRFMVRKLFGWLDKRYSEEYWAKLERNWRYWKRDRVREQRTMETIEKEKEEIKQKNSGLKEWTNDDNDEMKNIRDPYNKL